MQAEVQPLSLTSWVTLNKTPVSLSICFLLSWMECVHSFNRYGKSLSWLYDRDSGRDCRHQVNKMKPCNKVGAQPRKTGKQTVKRDSALLPKVSARHRSEASESGWRLPDCLKGGNSCMGLRVDWNEPDEKWSRGGSGGHSRAREEHVWNHRDTEPLDKLGELQVVGWKHK